MKPNLEEMFPFQLDDFQLEAINAVENGHNCIVCAPTGSGKTVIAEYAVKRALLHKKRCFYTTPLKALSNQKFGDLSRTYGEDNVGLLTGDVSVNRNASIVVMTTEVYRNMLYGTILGDVRSNLDHVESVVVDECHYMNDPDRGTVWEELVIYSPKDVQLIALSATVANADEMAEWLRKVHGETELIQSSYRPVPLVHHYYYDGKLYDLLKTNGRINPKLKKMVRTLDPEKKRMPGDPPVPKPDYPEKVVEALDKAGILPAIYFLFSRKKCDEAAIHCENAVKLPEKKRIALNKAIDEALEESPSLRDNAQLSCLRKGVAAHHAGLLPRWKALVENLFQQGLIQVVFATETLAAGINMPARTTVISAIAKYSDDGLRGMTASEFLQMSGRAGRRGMDEIGHVVITFNPHEPVVNAAELANSPADPLASHFTPCYGMVLNLLQNHTPEESRELVERSFGQFVSDLRKQPLMEELARLEATDLTYESLCEGETGDYEAWLDIRSKVSNLSRRKKGLEKVMHGSPGGEEALLAMEKELEEAKEQYGNSPCTDCPHKNICSKRKKEKSNLARRTEEVRQLIQLSSASYWEQFCNLEAVLEKVGYLTAHKPTELGLMASSLRATNILLLGEVALSHVLESLEPAEVAGVMSALVAGDTRAVPEFGMRPSQHGEEAINAICSIASDVFDLQERFKVDTPVWINSVFSGLTEYWCRQACSVTAGYEPPDLFEVAEYISNKYEIAWANWCPSSLRIPVCHNADDPAEVAKYEEEIAQFKADKYMAAKDAIAWDNVCAYLGNAEGDLIVAMRRTLDILRQFQRAP
ncbi:MAG: DEAD/DEAH box helicase, partial [bacterium]|nr:DEAD/DEAH box helicase [bacterium]